MPASGRPSLRHTLFAADDCSPKGGHDTTPPEPYIGETGVSCHHKHGEQEVVIYGEHEVVIYGESEVVVWDETV